MLDGLGDLYNGTAEPLVRWTEERFGTAAGWMVAIALVLFPIAAVVIAAIWLLG